MDDILEASVDQIYVIETLPEECKVMADQMTRAQVVVGTGLDAPGRTKEKPLPDRAARDVLIRGYY